MDDNKRLRKMFNKINKEYFDNEVKVKKIYFKTNKAEKGRIILGQFLTIEKTNGSHHYELSLHPLNKENETYLEQNMAHEMCHFYVDNHGKKFWKKYKRYKLLKELKMILQDEGKRITIHNA